MNKTYLYLHQEKEIIKRSRYFFGKYFELVRQSDKKKKVLDIGCGPGNVTHDILPHYFKYDVDEVIGIDKSNSMIRYALSTYISKKISFKEMDVMDDISVNKFQNHFDYVFSLWTLHWIRDQRNLYSRIYKIMKPDSDLLLTFVAKSDLFKVYRKIWNKRIYSQHIKDFDGMETSFQKSLDPAQELKSIMKVAGFDVHLCQLSRWRMLGPDDVRTYLISINSAYDQLPEHLRDDFITDHVREMDLRGGFISKGKFIIDFDMFIIYARKN
ncbi:hypothetical protein FQR65_LT01975 [Abscondita terminalis]|nr:hypothetical protein FQR65_LT01975 [Abscondita terminalis]